MTDAPQTLEMDSYEKLCVIIPCRDEEGSIKEVLEDLAKNLPGAARLVIDDASDDGTFRAALSMPGVIALSMPVNVGVGGGLQAGFVYALKNGYGMAAKFDGDGQHLANELPPLLEAMNKDGADVVAGSRFLESSDDGYQSTPLRRLGIALLNVATRIVSGQRITDSTSGFRVYNRKAMELLAKNYSSLDYPEPEEAVLLRKNKLKLVEVPVKMSPRKTGASSINAMTSAYFMLKMLLCIVMAALRAPAKES